MSDEQELVDRPAPAVDPEKPKEGPDGGSIS